MFFQAQKFDHQLTDTRNVAESALDAANAYKKIVNATNEARNASEEALKVAEKTNELLDGLEDKSLEADNESTLLLEEAQKLYESEKEIKPKLTESADLIADIKGITLQNDEDLKKINDSLSRLGEKNFEESSGEAMEISDLGELNDRLAVRQHA